MEKKELDRTKLLKKIKDVFFYEKRFQWHEIYTFGMKNDPNDSDYVPYVKNYDHDDEGTNVAIFFADKSIFDITYYNLVHDLKEPHNACFLWMYPEARAYFLGLYIYILVSGEADDDLLFDSVVYSFEPPKKDKKILRIYNEIKKYFSDRQKKVICDVLEYLEKYYSKDLIDVDFEAAYLEWCE